MERAAINVAKYVSDTRRINSVKDALNIFLMSLKQAHHGRDVIADLESKLQNYIVKFDIYKNHWQKQIGGIEDQDKKNRFEKIFKEATHDAFDSSNNFALACCFRDYLIHGSNLIENFCTNLSSASVLASRDKLLNDWEWSKTKTKLISSQPELIDLEKVVVESFEELCEINKQLIDARTAEIIGDCKYLLVQYEKIQIPEKYLTCWNIMEKRIYDNVIKNKDAHFNSRKEMTMNMIPLNWSQYQRIYEYWEQIK